MSVQRSAFGVERSDASRAVFLSYASQDAEAAKRIADALRTAGVEVWFDQDELVGGDAWDAKIRKQIKDCTLFVPIISANTQARTEGYFRLEWRLADQRTHLMAKGRPFLLPVVIDDTRDADAHVPDSFTEVQWTRLPDGETNAAFCARVQKLLTVEVAPVSDRRSETGETTNAGQRPALPRKQSFRPWAGPAILGIAAIATLMIWQPWHQRVKSAAAPTAPGAVAEVAQLRARMRPDEWTRADFDAFTPTIDRVIQANQENGEAWALRSIANSLLVIRNFDTGTKPLETGKEAADRALRLAPNSPLAELSLGLHLVAMISRGSDVRAPRSHIDRGLAGLPTESLTRYAELASFFLGYQFEGTDKSARAWLAADPHASFPAWILAQSYIARRQPVAAAKWAEQASADPDITGVRSLVTLFEARYYLQADLVAARAALDRVPVGQRGVHRVVASRFTLAMAERHYDQALQELARTPESMLLDRVFHGPKALLAGFAHEAAGRADVAQAQFRESERMLREELARDPDNQELRALLALNLACLGRADDARRELAAVEPLLRGQEPSVYSGQVIALIAQTHGALGEFELMAPWLRRLFTEPSPIPFTPAGLRLDPRFSRFVSDAHVQALLAEFSRLDASASNDVDQKSLAVLAFANLSDDKANEYFSDGISEELISVLGRVPGLTVKGSTSAFYFKHKEDQFSSPEIARQLGVTYLVRGSVRKAGDQVRITAQLTRAATDEVVWSSEPLTREVKDVFSVQEEVARLIAEKLQLKLNGGAATRAAINPEAYQLYLQARQAWNLRNADGYDRAEKLLARSIALAPDFAPAHAALVDVWTVRGQDDRSISRWGLRDSPAVARIVEKSRQAIALDPTSAESHASLGGLDGVVWQWSAGERELREAIRLNPNYASAHQWLGRNLMTRGRLDEALAELKQAAELDPLSPRILDNTSLALLNAQRPAEALEFADRALRLQPNAEQALAMKAMALARLGESDAAAAAARSLPPRYALHAEIALVTAGKLDAAAALLASIPQDNLEANIPGLIGLGRHEEALAALKPELLESDFVDLLLFNPVFDPLRNDPRFREVLKTVGLAEANDRAQAWRAAHPVEKLQANTK